MDSAGAIRQEIERVCSLYPAERDRVERVAATAFELDHPAVFRALERALSKILEAREPSRARRRIDELERAAALVTPDSPLVRGLVLGSRPALRRAAAVLAAVALLALTAGLVARLLA